MKKLFTSLAVLALAITANAQTLFTSPLDSQEDFARWTVVDNNRDGATWVYSSSGDVGKRVYYNYSGSNKADDWLISPEIKATEAGQYLVTYSYQGGDSMAESMKVYTGSQSTVDVLQTGMQKEYASILGAHSDYFLVNLEAGESFYLAFQACSAADRFRLYLSDIEVKKCSSLVDLAVTELVSPTSSEELTDSEKVTIKVANKGADAAVAGSSTVTLYVDGVEMFTEPIAQEIAAGEEITLELATPVDLSVAHHTYSVTAVVNNADDISMTNNTLTASVRHIGPATEPYTMGFEADEDLSEIKFLNVNQDSGYWSIQTDSMMVAPSHTGMRSMCYNYSTTNQADDWAFLDGISMSAGYHVLKYWVSTMDDSHKESYSIWWGNEASVAGMTNKIAEYENYTGAEYTEKVVIFELKEDQTVYVGFHATSAADQNWIAIDDISIYSISADDVEIAVSNLSNPTDYLVIKSNQDVVFDVMNQGVVDVNATVNIYVDDENIYSKEETLTAQINKTFTISDILSNIAEGEHVLKVNVYNAAETNTDDNTLVQTFRKLGEAPIMWDFENGKVPEEFTIRAEDNYTLSESAIAEFGETGVGIVEMEQNQYYGKYMLGMSSWFTQLGYADRWLVLPQVHVDEDDACFVWNAGSLDAYINEKYSVEISTKKDIYYNYTEALAVTAEDYHRHNRGVSLKKYVGKDIYIAIHLTTYDGDAIAFDNLGLYGCTCEQFSGVKDIIDADSLSGDTRVSVYDLNGRVLYNGDGSAFSLSGLAKGTYVLKTTSAEGTVTRKVIR